MKLTCALHDHPFVTESDRLNVVLYGGMPQVDGGTGGADLYRDIKREKIAPETRAWDFLTIAMSVVAADNASHRGTSPDGWTRELDLEIAVADPDFWNSCRAHIEAMLGFLSTDRWSCKFIGGGFQPAPPTKAVRPSGDCVALLSGGLDSLIGAIDLAATGRKLHLVSHLVQGDAAKQIEFASKIGGGLAHLQLNHNVDVPNPDNPLTQRARSLAFIAYGVLVGSSLAKYQAGDVVDLFICENGFVAINPALTPARIGSLSTRTAHPIYLAMLQKLFDRAGLRIKLTNPYRAKTKGEMLRECRDQKTLMVFAAQSTSCGRFLRYNYKHCGRCVPCQIRRAAFVAWRKTDTTTYVFEDLGQDDDKHMGFDDVRSVAIAISEARTRGTDYLVGAGLSSPLLGNTDDLSAMVTRGLAELKALHRRYKVK